mgnify:CR=1 FL=1
MLVFSDVFAKICYMCYFCKKQIIALIVLNVYELSENKVDVRFALYAEMKEKWRLEENG